MALKQTTTKKHRKEGKHYVYSLWPLGKKRMKSFSSMQGEEGKSGLQVAKAMAGPTPLSDTSCTTTSKWLISVTQHNMSYNSKWLISVAQHNMSYNTKWLISVTQHNISYNSKWWISVIKRNMHYHSKWLISVTQNTQVVLHLKMVDLCHKKTHLLQLKMADFCHTRCTRYVKPPNGWSLLYKTQMCYTSKWLMYATKDKQD